MTAFHSIPPDTTIGLIGSGYIARGIAKLLRQQQLPLGPVLTRSPRNRSLDFPFAENLTDSLNELLEKSTFIVEACGEPVYVTPLIEQCLAAGKPVVTLDSEFHVTTGSYFAGKGLLTEAEGDQPGCMAALRREALAMGFTPQVYGNVKGFLNHKPTRQQMEFFARKQGISVAQTTSFTDGTKVQIEQAFCANAFGAGILQPGMTGLESAELDAGTEEPIQACGNQLAKQAAKHGGAIADFIVVPGNASLFVTGTHSADQRESLAYMKMGDGPFYTLIKPYHLCHFEVLKTVRDVLRHGRHGVLMDNSAQPQISVNTISKRPLRAGEKISRGIGSFAVRGEAVELTRHPGHLPIGLVHDAVVRRDIATDEVLTMDDVDLPATRALEIWHEMQSSRVAVP